MSRIKYSRYCVAFLDILGFKNLIEDEHIDTIHRIFKNIRYTKQLIRRISEDDSWWNQIGQKTKFYFFSDSIIIAIPMSEPMAFELVASHCMMLQHALWYHFPVWLRGGITIGDLYCGQSEIFGPALIDAYILESNIAKYPRIIMSEDTYQTGINNSTDKNDIVFISEQPDNLRMVETLKYFTQEPNRSQMLRSVQNTLSKETNPSILEKYKWIVDYHGISF